MADEKRRAGDMIVDPAELPVESGTPYPAPHDQIVKGRHRSRLSPPLGLTKFGVNVLRIEPGAQSSARHWHSKQDEFVYVLEGEATLVTDEGDTVLTAGMGRTSRSLAPGLLWPAVAQQYIGVAEGLLAHGALSVA